jgi:hypothetical protein
MLPQKSPNGVAAPPTSAPSTSRDSEKSRLIAGGVYILTVGLV